MSERLPSLGALRAFEAAARHLSLTRAAEELRVTPAAISHQVRALEADLGFALLERDGRRVVPTAQANAGLAELRRGFDLVSEGVRRMRSSRAVPMLRISAEPSFAGMWLVPRLGRFRALHPELDVLIDASDRLADFERDPVDVALRWGGGRYAGLVSERLFEETVYPICHPRLLDGPHALRRPADLARHTLIHLDWDQDKGAWPHWRDWLDAAGAPEVDAGRGLHFTAHSDCVRAAAEGEGVTLTTDAAVIDDLRRGRLVRPFELALKTDVQLYLVMRPDRAAEPHIAAFRAWIVAAAAESVA